MTIRNKARRIVPNERSPEALRRGLGAVNDLVDTVESVATTLDGGTTAKYFRGDQTWQDLNKAAIGCGFLDGGSAAQYLRGDQTWQTLNKAAVGLANVENTAISTWAGSTDLVTVGTITTGVWNAGAVTSSGPLMGTSLVLTGSGTSLVVSGSGTADIYGNLIRIRTSKTPLNHVAAGNAGEICWDSGYLYVAVGTNSWKRVALASW